MHCEAARNAWHCSLGGPAPDAASAEHLAGCAGCRDYITDMERIVDRLHQLRRETEGLSSTSRVRAAQPSRGGFGVLLRFAALIALAIGIYAATVGLRPISPRVAEAPAPPSVGERIGGSADAQWPSSHSLGLTLKGESARNLLAVAAPALEPEVQMYWLYPKLAGASEFTK